MMKKPEQRSAWDVLPAKTLASLLQQLASWDGTPIDDEAEPLRAMAAKHRRLTMPLFYEALVNELAPYWEYFERARTSVAPPKSERFERALNARDLAVRAVFETYKQALCRVDPERQEGTVNEQFGRVLKAVFYLEDAASVVRALFRALGETRRLDSAIRAKNSRAARVLRESRREGRASVKGRRG